MPARASIRNRPTSELVRAARELFFVVLVGLLIFDPRLYSNGWRVHPRGANPSEEQASALITEVWFTGVRILPVIALTEGAVVVVFGPGVVGPADLGRFPAK